MADIRSICKTLLAYDTPTLANAIERLNLRSRVQGFTDHTIHNYVKTGRICGVAVTCRMEAHEKGAPAIDRNLLWEAVAKADGPAILVIQDDSIPKGIGALVGEVVGNHLVQLGCVGIMTDGTVRDLDELEELGLSTYGLGVCLAHGYVRTTDVGGPVTIGGLRIETGDLLHGDYQGVMSIPRDAALKLPQLAEEVRAEEATRIALAKSPQFGPKALLRH